MARSGDEGLEQRLDRWVEAGRQLVDGVSGARPGSRTPARTSLRRSGSRLNPAELGRWVETKLDWLLDEDAGDDWREPWQSQRSRLQPGGAEPQSRTLQPRNPQPRGRRRPLDAISRRPPASGAPPAAPAEGPEYSSSYSSAAASGDWPDDALFSVPRWQRQPGGERSTDPDPVTQPQPQSQPIRQSPEPPGRPLPRSSRRR